MEFTDRIAVIKIGFDCNPQEGDTRTAPEIYESVVTRVNTFLSGEPEGSFQKQRFSHPGTNHLWLKIFIPVTSIDDAKAIETKLVNNINNFPPRLTNNPTSFMYGWKELIVTEE